MENRGNLPGPLIQVPRLLIALVVPQAIPGQTGRKGGQLSVRRRAESSSLFSIFGSLLWPPRVRAPKGDIAVCLYQRKLRPRFGEKSRILICWSILDQRLKKLDTGM